VGGAESELMVKTIGYILGIGKRPFPLGSGSVITFGRESQNSVPLDDLLASRNHACVEVLQSKVVIRDLGSFNGTFVNERRLDADERHVLSSGDVIRIGGKQFSFVSEEAGVEPQKALQTRTRAFSETETLGWDAQYSPADEEVQIPQPGAPGLGGMSPALATQKIRLNKAIPATLAGTINAGNLPQIIQFIHSGIMTGRLQVNGAMLSGEILFLEGQLYSARAGKQSGVEAVYACALESGGGFSFNKLEPADVQKAHRNINENTMQVVFECCRRADEGLGKPS